MRSKSGADLNAILQSFSPITRLAVLVGYGDDQYVVTLYGVNDAVGEAIQPAAPGLRAERVPRLGKLGNQLERLKRFN